MIKVVTEFIGILSIFLIFCLNNIETGPNNLHLVDGTSTADIIGDDIFFEVVDPVELEYTYRIRPAKDFGAPFNESFHIENVPLVVVDPKSGCEPLKNIDDVEGNVALIERGECSFKMKTLIAEKAGARAVIVTDIVTSNKDYFIEMIDDSSVEETHIPAAFLLGKDGIMITKTLQRLNRNYAIINLPVNLTFTPVYEMNEPPW